MGSNFDLNMTVTLPQDLLYLFLKQFEGKELGLLHSFPHFDKHYLNSYKHVGLNSKKSPIVIYTYIIFQIFYKSNVLLRCCINGFHLQNRNKTFLQKNCIV